MKRKGLWGYINEAGSLVIPCWYEDANDFAWHGHVATVKSKLGWQFITKREKLVGEIAYDDITDYYLLGY